VPSGLAPDRHGRWLKQLMPSRIRTVPSAVLIGLTLAATGRADPAGPGDLPEVAAEIVSRDASDAPRGVPATVRLAHGVVRLETPELPTAYFLVDSAAGTALLVRPVHRIFTDAREATLLTQIFVPVNPDAPCPAWQAAALVAGVPRASDVWRCERIAAQGDADAGTIRYRVLPPGQPPDERWIDPVLRFPVRLRTADGSTLALEHIRVEPQPAALFSIPAGFARLDPRTLIERIRHSDVWVTPPR
jgi:hypothetical protein